jgi:hypothetical protein
MHRRNDLVFSQQVLEEDISECERKWNVGRIIRLSLSPGRDQPKPKQVRVFIRDTSFHVEICDLLHVSYKQCVFNDI